MLGYVINGHDVRHRILHFNQVQYGVALYNVFLQNIINELMVVDDGD